MTPQSKQALIRALISTTTPSELSTYLGMEYRIANPHRPLPHTLRSFTRGLANGWTTTDNTLEKEDHNM